MAQKTLEEIKADIAYRAGRINPFEQVKKEDVDQVLKNLTSLDANLWGREWGKFGAKYEALGDLQEKQGEQKQAGETFLSRLRVLSRRPISGAEQPGENGLLQGRAADLSQSRALHGPAAGALRDSFRR